MNKELDSTLISNTRSICQFPKTFKELVPSTKEFGMPFVFK
jgi:hypothetical protein